MDDETAPPRGGGGGDGSSRIYIGNLPPSATRADIENHFNSNGSGKINEIKLMSGFGFIEYMDPIDAREAVPNMNGTDFMGQRLNVQFAKGGREHRGPPPFYGERERTGPRTRRTQFRMNMNGLPPDCSWQDLKDFARCDGLDVVFSEIPRERDGTGFVEYETEADLKTAVEKLDGLDFRGSQVTCVMSIQDERPRDNRYRSRSPPPYRGSRGYGGPPRDYDDGYYDRRGPPPRSYQSRGGYRDRSPPPRRGGGYYDDRGNGGYGGRSPPPRSRGPPGDDYPPPRGGDRRSGYPADDYPPPARSYGSRGPPPYEAEPYGNGSRGGGGYPPSPPPPRRRSPGRGGHGDSGYDRPRYW